MTPPALIRWAAGAVGAVLVLLNAVHLSLGFARLRRALAEEPIPARFAEPLATAWLYLGSLGLLLGVLLLWLLPDLGAGNPAAWKAAAAIGAGLVVTGIASYLATGRHPGLLVISVLGLVLLIPLFLGRGAFPGR